MLCSLFVCYCFLIVLLATRWNYFPAHMTTAEHSSSVVYGLPSKDSGRLLDMSGADIVYPWERTLTVIPSTLSLKVKNDGCILPKMRICAFQAWIPRIDKASATHC